VFMTPLIVWFLFFFKSKCFPTKHSLNVPRRTDGGRGGFDMLGLDRELLLFTPLGKKKALLFKHALVRPSLSLSVASYSVPWRQQPKKGR
jgi:hypothetical protein